VGLHVRCEPPEFRTTAKVNLSDKGPSLGVAYSQMYMSGTASSSCPIPAGDDRFNPIFSLAVCPCPAPKSKPVREVVLPGGVGLPDVDHRSCEGGQAVLRKHGACQRQPGAICFGSRHPMPEGCVGKVAGAFNILRRWRADLLSSRPGDGSDRQKNTRS